MILCPSYEYLSISGRWEGVCKRLCSIKHRLDEDRISPQVLLQPTNPLFSLGVGVRVGVGDGGAINSATLPL